MEAGAFNPNASDNDSSGELGDPGGLEGGVGCSKGGIAGAGIRTFGSIILYLKQ